MLAASTAPAIAMTSVKDMRGNLMHVGQRIVVVLRSFSYKNVKIKVATEGGYVRRVIGGHVYLYIL